MIRCGLAIFAVATLLLVGMRAHAEAPESPYKLLWSFPADDLSAIDVDRGDLARAASRAPSRSRDICRPAAAEEAEEAGAWAENVPRRELRIEQLDGSGTIRSSLRYVATLVEWRRRLGEPMVERLEDEFDAHLRMLLPRKAPPRPAGDPP